MTSISFRGIFPAAITPFTDKGELDLTGFRLNLNYYLENGVRGLVINGSTGEGVSLTKDERVQTIKTAVELSKNRAIVIAGTGAPTTGHAIGFSKDAEKAGADAVLVITPSTVIPNKEGLYRYFKDIAEAIDIPMIAYNLPQHTGVTLGVDTLVRLVDEELVAGVKESSGNMAVMGQIIREVGKKISVLTGSDDLLLQSFVTGASGAIIALGNIAPKQTVQLFEAVQSNRLEEARELYFKLLPVASAISSPENFPAPVKEFVRLSGRSAGPCRSPVMPLSSEERDSLSRILKLSGLAQ